MTQLSEIMNPKLITVETRASLRQAQRMLDQHHIRHLFVMDGKRLVGIVTDRDLRKAAPSSKSPLTTREREEFMDELKVMEVMSRKLITAAPTTTVREAAKVMVHEKIGCLPVVHGNTLVGIVTETDLLEILVRGEETS
ncbi:Inosine-5'-monophosphate dehydrogenase [Candidatus Methylomirabilis lanthanidiphila]|uniref:Inosine-5'-monophosphate dehydrogenase n=1 Tax=Candidatus Methylomirabilis lanthanidiphila TaxID=2211376 RepID=A0A564ZMB6_9BACT|nr:CBS domain-containing protein [Candidatus Methylomirabilis lanthanidiphila]VUZ85792.1 Inosine-5'-monophosphate dehydrogenase [Candidatus Methylomirabilis lanthanidiphila]